MSAPVAEVDKTERRHGLGFWAVAYAFMVVLAYCAVPTPLYAIYAQRDGFSSFTVTVIFAAYAVGVVVSLFTVGHISDWHGRRRLAVPALLISIVSAVIFLTWRALPGLIVARVISGLGVGAMTATATAWLSELHAVHRPQASVRRAQVVATAANLGGIGFGPLISGALAQWTGAPLTVPYLVSLGALLVALALVLASPETRERPVRMPAYRPQRVSVPPHAMTRYVAAAVGAGISFSAFGLFTSLAPAFLAGTLHRTSHALAGVTAFAVFASAVVSQTAIAGWPTRRAVGAGIAGMLSGMAVVVIAVWIPKPSLALFLLGGVVTGAGAGALFKGVVSTVAETAVPERRAEALAGMFLAGYIGLSVPVLGLGVLTQYVTPRASLLIFAAALAVTILAATPKLTSRRDAAAVSVRDGSPPPTLAS